MIEQIAVEQAKEIRSTAALLLRQGEQHALAGLLGHALALLTQSWELARDSAPDLANAAAWEAAWLLVRQQSYAAAAGWFGRVTAPSADSPLWPATRQALIEQYRLHDHAALASSTPHITAAALPPLRVANLGRFVLERDGEPLPACHARKALAVFRYLLTRRYHSARKEELIDLFWADAPPREAAHSLHVAVATLRRHLDTYAGSYIVLEASRYALNSATPLHDECAHFLHLCDVGERAWQAGDEVLAQRHLIEAVACYAGEYYVDDGDLGWALAEQERVLMQYLRALDCLGRMYMAQQQYEAAIACYLRLLERDSYREDAYAQTMRCYLALNRRTDALRQYDRCARILQHDLGFTPMPSLQALRNQIVQCASLEALNLA